jgi:hypothetical protein
MKDKIKQALDDILTSERFKQIVDLLLLIADAIVLAILLVITYYISRLFK